VHVVTNKQIATVSAQNIMLENTHSCPYSGK